MWVLLFIIKWKNESLKVKEKTYIWVSVLWKTKSWSWNFLEFSGDFLQAVVQDRQCVSCDFFENPRYCSQVVGRLLTKHDILYPFFQLVSQDNAQDLIYRIRTLPYSGVSRSEFHVRCLRTRFVSQGVVCLSSAGLGIPWTSSVTFFNDSRGPTLFISVHMSFA